VSLRADGDAAAPRKNKPDGERNMAYVIERLRHRLQSPQHAWASAHSSNRDWFV